MTVNAGIIKTVWARFMAALEQEAAKTTDRIPILVVFGTIREHGHDQFDISDSLDTLWYDTLPTNVRVKILKLVMRDTRDAARSN